MKKIIFLDLDGTLWTFEQIPSSALEAIELARKNGHENRDTPAASAAAKNHPYRRNCKPRGN